MSPPTSHEDGSFYLTLVTTTCNLMMAFLHTPKDFCLFTLVSITFKLLMVVILTPKDFWFEYPGRK